MDFLKLWVPWEMEKVPDSLSWLTSKLELYILISRQEMKLKPLYRNKYKL